MTRPERDPQPLALCVGRIGNVAMLLGRPLRWDPQREDFLDDPEASQHLGRPQRAPWTIDHIDQWI